MNEKELINLICEVVDKEIDIKSNSSLLGGELIDSMTLVQICLRLEEEADKQNFDFDWTSEKAMSNMNSIFKSVDTLCEEFNKQKLNYEN